MELELPEKATVEMLIARREGTNCAIVSRSHADRRHRSFDHARVRRCSRQISEMLKNAGSDRADIYVDLGRTLEKFEQKTLAIETTR